ncbi:MAG: hypothetical protein HY315_07275 [Acidobacteria bacterium]|nr:hypothetical protein [Acidobacteriota bacterium]
MNRRRFLVFALALPALVCQACLFRRKKEEQPTTPRIYNVLGIVQHVSPTSITVQTRDGTEMFAMTGSTVRGGEFAPGMYVHIYYYQEQNQDVAKMVVERVRK